MIYDTSNAQGSKVYYGGLAQIKQVLSVDTDKNEVVVADEPTRVVDGEIATATLSFECIKVWHEQGSVHRFDCFRRKYQD